MLVSAPRLTRHCDEARRRQQTSRLARGHLTVMPNFVALFMTSAQSLSHRRSRPSRADPLLRSLASSEFEADDAIIRASFESPAPS